jgi:hypothetical protein
MYDLPDTMGSGDADAKSMLNPIRLPQTAQCRIFNIDQKQSSEDEGARLRV